MSTDGKNSRESAEGEPKSLPEPPGVLDEPVADSGLVRLIERAPTAVPPGGPDAPEAESGRVRRMEQAPTAAPSGETDLVTTSPQRPQAVPRQMPTPGELLLESSTIPARPVGKSQVLRPVKPAVDAAAAADPGFETEQTVEWSIDHAQDLAGEGEDSHVIGGRYRLIEGLAMGGMGAVFKVKHLKLGKEFALKIIHSSLSEDANMQKFFFREARILSQLQHPNIVDVTDFGSDDRFGAYLVMEHLRGESLHARLDREEKLAVGPSLIVGQQVAEALHSMHSDDLVHCDIKPENIFLVRQPSGRRQKIVAKLIDFGLSRNMARGAELDESEVGGTPIYAAPEQISGLAPQPSMDIYAVGELLYHMLTGQPPFVGSIPEICAAKISRAPQSPSELLDTPLDPHLEALIMKSLGTRPEQRHASMAQLVFEIRTVIDMLGIEAERPSQKRSTTATVKVKAAEPLDLMQDVSLPLFSTDAQGRVLRASRAFESLVGGAESQIIGQPLSATKLGNIYPGVDADLLEAAAQKVPLQRKIQFLSSSNQQSALMVWLVPRTDGHGKVVRFWGVAIPI